MHRPHGFRTIAASLPLLILPGCGGDSTEPTPPDVSGVYQAVTQPGAATCDPASAIGVLDLVTGGIPVRVTLRVEQLDAQVRMTALAAEGLDGRPVRLEDPQPILTPLLAEGAVQFETHLSSQVTLGGRTFFEETTLSSSGRFERDADPITFSLTTSGIQVFRESSVSAPVFATCTRPQITTGVRTGV